MLLLLLQGRGREAPGVGRERVGERKGRGRGGECLVTSLASRGRRRRERLEDGNQVNPH